MLRTVGKNRGKRLARLLAALTVFAHFAPVDHSGHGSHQLQDRGNQQAPSLVNFIYDEMAM